MSLSILRNAVFAVTGIGVIILYAISGNTNGYHMTRMVAAIIISFGCYLPVTLFSKTKPKVGILMIPKTCAYMWGYCDGTSAFIILRGKKHQPFFVWLMLSFSNY